jgi:uncharacterized damage-inducible protein DinB
MPTLSDVQRLFEFHHWATDRVLDALAPATVEQLDKPWGGSFGTGRALLRHVVGVERLWTDRWNGNSPKAIPDYPPTTAGRDFRALWELVKVDQRRFIAALSGERLAAPLQYVNLKGEPWSYPLADVLTHCVNHGTYHRGQLTHLLRDLGMTAPGTDYIRYIDELSTATRGEKR